jgi:ligand-binding SRPBCC domain-containing protein
MTAAGGLRVFEKRSIVGVSAERLFRWHERPGAILDLMPLRNVARVEHQDGGLREGGRIVFSVGAGPLRIRWEARHFGYVEGRQFCDEQVSGPFAVWRHTHRFEPIDDERCAYADRVEYKLPGGTMLNALAAPFLRIALGRMFARRHDIVAGCAASLSM